MACNVLMGTLNPTHSLTLSLTHAYRVSHDSIKRDISDIVVLQELPEKELHVSQRSVVTVLRRGGYNEKCLQHVSLECCTSHPIKMGLCVTELFKI